MPKEDTQFKPGISGCPTGKPPGTLNRLTVEFKNVLEQAFHAIGGMEAFNAWAREHPSEFYDHCMKLLPRNINISGGLSLEQLLSEAYRIAQEKAKIIDVTAKVIPTNGATHE